MDVEEEEEMDAGWYMIYKNNNINNKEKMKVAITIELHFLVKNRNIIKDIIC